MSNLRDDVIKRNIAFMYGRNKEEEAFDPDKRAFVRTSHKYVEHDMISNFSGDYEFLSPGYQCPVVLAGDEIVYPSFEHALQASKTTDPAIRSQLKDTTDIRELKRLAGRVCRPPEDWKENSPDIAAQLLRDKFFRNKELTTALMKTEHRTIQYVNDFKDMFWGLSMDKKGQNKLGKLLETVRFSIEKGNILDEWIKDHFKLIDIDKVSITVKVRKDGEEIRADRESFARKAVLELGKVDDNDLIIEHPTASRRHALLVVDDCKGALLIDLNTPNGTFVDGNRISPFTATPIASEDTVVLFGASRREYFFCVDTTADVKRREEIYRRMGDPDGGKDSAEDTTVFVGNLPYDCLEQQLRDVFESCGSIRSLTLPRDKSGSGESSGGGRGIAFITFDTVSGLLQALTRDGDEIGGRPMKVKRSEAKSKATGKETSKQTRPPQSGRGGHGRCVDTADDEVSHYMPRPGQSFPVASRPDERSRGGSRGREGGRDRGGGGGGGRERERERRDGRYEKTREMPRCSRSHSRSKSRSSDDRDGRGKIRRKREERRRSPKDSRKYRRSSSRSRSRSRGKEDNQRRRSKEERQGRGSSSSRRRTQNSSSSSRSESSGGGSSESPPRRRRYQKSDNDREGDGGGEDRRRDGRERKRSRFSDR